MKQYAEYRFQYVGSICKTETRYFNAAQLEQARTKVDLVPDYDSSAAHLSEEEAFWLMNHWNSKSTTCKYWLVEPEVPIHESFGKVGEKAIVPRGALLVAEAQSLGCHPVQVYKYKDFYFGISKGIVARVMHDADAMMNYLTAHIQAMSDTIYKGIGTYCKGG